MRRKRGCRKACRCKQPRADVVKGDEVVWLRAAADGIDSGGMVDTSAAVDVPLRYAAVRSRLVTVGGERMEIRSELSAPVEVMLRDVYPPAVPMGLVAAGFPMEGTEQVAVDLVWQPNVEKDLAGYFVYRQTVGADGVVSAAEKLNAALVAVPAFHDATAKRGVKYRYTVTAVDAKGNASAASLAADVDTGS